MKINWPLACVWGLVGCLLATAACAPPASSEEKLPSPSTIFYGTTGYGYVHEFRLEDGTVCVVIHFGYNSRTVHPISCDFSKRRE